MKTSFLVLLASLSMVVAQTPPPVTPSPRPLAEPGVLRPNVRPLPPTGDAAVTPPKPKVNYRIRLEIKEGKESPVEISVVACDGRIRSQMINPKRVVIDDREIPSTLDLTATLTPIEGDKCQLTLFLGRSVPYVTGKYSGPGGQTSSQYQQMQIGLDTSVILQLGKPLVIQSDSTQQVKVTLEKVTE